MDWSLVILIGVVLIFAYRGYRNGLLKSISRILSLVAGYACAILYTGQFTRVIESQFPLQGIASFVTASLVLFFGAGLAVVVVFWVIAKLLSDDDSVSTASAVGGAGVGSVTGVLLAIVIVWGFAFLRDIWSPADSGLAAAAPPSEVENVANRVAGKAVSAAMSLGDANPEVTRLSAALVESPAEMTRLAQRLGRSEDLARLLNDPENLAVLDRGDSDALRRLPAFQQLVNNPDMQALASATGLAGDVDGNDEPLDAALAIKLTDVWGRAQRVKNDSRVQEILGDAEFQRQIQSGNPLELIANERLLELANIIFAEDAATSETGAERAVDPRGADAMPATPTEVKKLYRWTDENGQIFYSDVEPGS